jgi:MFS family permease
LRYLAGFFWGERVPPFFFSLLFLLLSTHGSFRSSPCLCKTNSDIVRYLSIFIVALDRTIIATAIPKITDEFNSIEDIGWYGSAYMLAAACLFPISGRIYQLYSTKWVFVISLVIFEAGSALCGAAPSSVAFIIGRAIAGLGSACIMTGGIMIILPLIPLRKRPIYMSFFGIAFGVASVLGPVMGGLFTDKV